MGIIFCIPFLSWWFNKKEQAYLLVVKEIPLKWRDKWIRRNYLIKSYWTDVICSIKKKRPSLSFSLNGVTRRSQWLLYQIFAFFLRHWNSRVASKEALIDYLLYFFLLLSHVIITFAFQSLNVYPVDLVCTPKKKIQYQH